MTTLERPGNEIFLPQCGEEKGNFEDFFVCLFHSFIFPFALGFSGMIFDMDTKS